MERAECGTRRMHSHFAFAKDNPRFSFHSACYHESAMNPLPAETDFIVVGAGIAGLRA
jgi:hypothetical protein